MLGRGSQGHDGSQSGQLGLVGHHSGATADGAPGTVEGAQSAVFLLVPHYGLGAALRSANGVRVPGLVPLSEHQLPRR